MVARLNFLTDEEALVFQSNVSRTLADLRRGAKVSDVRFDQLYSREIRNLSCKHWTPVCVAMRVAELLVTDSDTRILDVGSGSGKFCLVGALTSPGNFYGVEQRLPLVETASSLVQRYQVERVAFYHADMTAFDWSSYHAFYLFNPFYENLAPSIRIDQSIAMSDERYQSLVRATYERLSLVPVGTRVATFHGYGGTMPKGFDLILREPIATGVIELWIRSKSAA